MYVAFAAPAPPGPPGMISVNSPKLIVEACAGNVAIHPIPPIRAARTNLLKVWFILNLLFFAGHTHRVACGKSTSWPHDFPAGFREMGRREVVCGWFTLYSSRGCAGSR